MKKVIEILSPGRINVIGEHIDYNGGYVLPGATDLCIKLTFKESDKEFSEVYSSVIDKKCEIHLDNLSRSNIQWENYLIGSLISILKRRKVEIKVFSCLIEGNLPLGSGISSSSSLICGFVKGIDLLNNLEFSDEELLSISREVEYDFIGLRGGVMDQFTIINSKKNNLILLDTKDNSSKYIHSNFGDYRLLLLNTNIKHDLSVSSYNDRVRECESALQIINDSGYKLKYLTEIKVQQLLDLKNIMPVTLFKRALFVVEENDRVISSVQCLKNLDFKSLGRLMYSSHEGLRNLYQVSCKELDFLVESAITYEKILGARMMGGGFGGCTLNLIHKDFIDSFIEDIKEKYFNKFSLNLIPIVTNLGNGISYKFLK